ncbi:MAG: methyltransferase domain-containing protein [Vicinamibacterales bacterium]
MGSRLAAMDPAVLSLLACPKDGRDLTFDGSRLTCPAGHHYPVFHGVPFLVRDDVPHAHWAADVAVDVARSGRVPAEWLVPASPDPAVIDGYVQQAISATNGNLYLHLRGRLPRYPIPRFPMVPATPGARIVELGCGWGRWSLAAARAGFIALGTDPYPASVFAARRVARQLGIAAQFVVADARHLPFRAGALDAAFSFSVLQHLDDEAIGATARGLGRVLAPGGEALLQFAGRYGPLAVVRMAGRGFRQARAFEVRYRDPAALRALFADAIGPTTVEAEGFLSLNARVDDLDLMRPSGAAIVRLSAAGCAAARRWPALARVADSVWIRSCARGLRQEPSGHDGSG